MTRKKDKKASVTNLRKQVNDLQEEAHLFFTDMKKEFDAQVGDELKFLDKELKKLEADE